MIDYREDAIWTVYVHIVPREISGYDNDKYYVGITKQTPSQRWLNGEGYRGQVFYNAIQKYGWENILHEIFASNLTSKEAQDMEVRLIKELHSLSHDNGYNVTFGGEGKSVPSEQATWYGKHLPEEMKKKISETKKRMNQTGENAIRYGCSLSDETKKKISISNSKAVVQLSTDFEIISKYYGAEEAARITGTNVNGIRQACNEKTFTAGGYIWIYQSNLENLDSIKERYAKRMEEFKDRLSSSKRMTIYKINENFAILAEYKSITSAAKENEVSVEKIRYARKIKKMLDGCFWVFKKDYEQFVQEKNGGGVQCQ